MKRVAALFLLALSLRLGYGLTLAHSPLSPDERSYDARAWNLASTGVISNDGKPSAWRTPSYLIFLAAIYKLAGHRHEAVRAVQAILGALLVLLLMGLARRITSSTRAVWATGLLAALYPFFIYYENHLISDSFMVFWLVTTILLFMRWMDSPTSTARAAVCGAAFSALCLTKTLFIPYFVLLVLIESARALIRKRDYLRYAGAAAVLILVCMVPIFAWGMRNQKLFGRFLLDSHGGETLMQCIMFRPQIKQGTYPEHIVQQPIWQRAQGMNEAEADAYYMSQTKAWIREHPGLYIRQSLGNLKDFWRLYPRADQDYPEGRFKLILISLLTEPALLLGGIIGLIKTRDQAQRLYPIYLAILVISGVHALTTGQMRYRLAVMPFAIVFSAIIF